MSNRKVNVPELNIKAIDNPSFRSTITAEDLIEKANRQKLKSSVDLEAGKKALSACERLTTRTFSVNYPREPQISPREILTSNFPVDDDVFSSRKLKNLPKIFLTQSAKIDVDAIDNFIKIEVFDLLRDKGYIDDFSGDKINLTEVSRRAYTRLQSTKITYASILDRVILIENYFKNLVEIKKKTHRLIQEFLIYSDNLSKCCNLAGFLRELKSKNYSKNCRKLGRSAISLNKKQRKQTIKLLNEIISTTSYQHLNIVKLYQSYILEFYLVNTSHHYDGLIEGKLTKINQRDINEVFKTVKSITINNSLLETSNFRSQEILMAYIIIILKNSDKNIIDVDKIADIYKFLQEFNWVEYHDHFNTYVLADDLTVDKIVNYFLDKTDLFPKKCLEEKISSFVFNNSFYQGTSRDKLMSMFIPRGSSSSRININKKLAEVPDCYQLNNLLIPQLKILRLIACWPIADYFIKDLYYLLFAPPCVVTMSPDLNVSIDIDIKNRYSVKLFKNYTVENKNVKIGEITFCFTINLANGRHFCSLNIDNVVSWSDERLIEALLRFKKDSCLLLNSHQPLTQDDILHSKVK